MKNTVRVSKDQLIEMLKNWNFGAQPASIQYITTPKLTKDGKILFGDIMKIANIGCMIGYVYENSVNNERERENLTKNFIAKPLWNGKGIRISTALSMHKEKGTFYLTYKHQQTFRSFYFDKNMVLIPNKIIKPYFPDNTPKNQGVSEGKEIHHREVSIDNIVRVKFRKTTYELI